MNTQIEIESSTTITVHDKLTWALESITKAIASTGGGRNCGGPTWARMHDCQREIIEAMRMIRDGKQVK